MMITKEVIKNAVISFGIGYFLSKLVKKVETASDNKNFAAYAAKSMEFEGGYSDNRNDPGGETKWGIAKRYYPDIDIKNLTQKDATYIYKRDYWERYKCSMVSDHIGFLFFDTVLHQGGDFATRALQRITGADVDGILGPKTAEASEFAKIENLAQERINRCNERIADNSDLEEFRRGWNNRINMALAFQKKLNT
jgi:lysozyme family protein